MHLSANKQAILWNIRGIESFIARWISKWYETYLLEMIKTINKKKKIRVPMNKFFTSF
jgi:hypothetical protein